MPEAVARAGVGVRARLLSLALGCALSAGCAGRSEAARPVHAQQVALPVVADVHAVEPLRVGATAPCPENMVRVAAGAYLAQQGAEPTHIPALCVDVTEVSVDAYAVCAAERRCLPAPTEPRKAHLLDASCNVSELSRGGHPLNCVDALLAQGYCKAVGKRLPTDIEWWWVARGGTAGRRFPWGDDSAEDQACWSGPRTLDGTCGAGSHPEDASADGVLDLAGNVSEWARITATAQPGPTREPGAAYRVHGGNFASRAPAELMVDATCGSDAPPLPLAVGDGQPTRVLRVGPRERCESDALRSPVVGFRCVVEVDP